MIANLRLHNIVSQHQRESQMSPAIKSINASNNNSGNNGSKTSLCIICSTVLRFCIIRLIDDLLLSNFKLGTSLKPIQAMLEVFQLYLDFPFQHQQY